MFVICCNGNGKLWISKLIAFQNSKRMGNKKWVPTASEYVSGPFTPLSLSVVVISGFEFDAAASAEA